MANSPTTVEPVFLLNKALPAASEHIYTVAEICSAAEKTCGFDTIEGAQRIGNLWRVYPKNIDARVALLTRNIVLRGVEIQPKDRNPYIVRDDNGVEKESHAMKVFISNVPLSFNNQDILLAIEKLAKPRSHLIEERDRVDGKLTRWKTGRRFLFVDPPPKPLPKTLQIGPFRASIYHRGQAPAACKKCLAKNHTTADCSSEVRCRVCFELGHVSGAPECNLVPRATPSSDVSSLLPEEHSKSDQQAGEKKQTVLTFSARHVLSQPNQRSTPSHSRQPRPNTRTGEKKRARSLSTQGRSPTSTQQAKKTAFESTENLFSAPLETADITATGSDQADQQENDSVMAT